jgi:subtilisin family serine protease
MVFSSGNGSSDRKNGFFQSIAYPDILSIGGCFVSPDMELELSDISSGYKSEIFDGRYVPDLCGICGKMPKAQLILMPTHPGCIFDISNGKRDGTGQEDGWMVSSGTSAAAAYVTGLIALYLQIHPDTNRREIKKILQNLCIPITKGINYMGYPTADDWNNCSSGSGFLTGKHFNYE